MHIHPYPFESELMRININMRFFRKNPLSPPKNLQSPLTHKKNLQHQLRHNSLHEPLLGRFQPRLVVPKLKGTQLQILGASLLPEIPQ